MISGTHNTKLNPADKVYTPDHIAANVVDTFKPSGVIMEPFRGKGAISKYLPHDHLWCEIDDGKDFLLFQGKVDWIITNPPYSTFTDMLSKALLVAENIVFITPINKVLGSMVRLKMINKAHGIKQIHFIGSGRDIGFPFCFPVGAIHIQKAYKGDIKPTYYKEAA